MSSTVHSYYSYDPSVPAAAVFAVLYGLSFVATFVLWIRYRAWVWVLMVLAAGMEGVGYIFRTISAKSPDKRELFIVQFCLIVLAPVLMAAAYYVLFGRIVFHVVPPRSRTVRTLWVSPRYVTPIFVVCDIIAFLLQTAGAIIISGTQLTDSDAQQKLNRGKTIVLIGLAIQIACFGLFCIIAIRFNFTARRFMKDFDHRIGSTPGDKYYTVDGLRRRLLKRWQSLLVVVNVTCLLILVRSVYRVCEFALGKQGYIERHEWFAYVFDAVPILPCVALYIYWHPARYLPYLGFRLPLHIRKEPGDYQTSVSLSNLE